MLEENKIEAGGAAEKENTEEKVDMLKEEDVAAVREGIEKEVIKQNEMSEKDAEIYQKIMDEAGLPVKFTDEKFKLGKQELDIRPLTKKNKEQMFFRTIALLNVYLKQLLGGQTDLLRLLMVIADKLGVEDIVGATDDVIQKIQDQQDLKAKVGSVKEPKKEEC